MFGLGGTEMLILLVLGVLLFGKRLPEVGRSLGKGLMEFKKGIAGIEDEVHGAVNRSDYSPHPEPPRPPQRIAATAPKYEEPTDNNGPPVL